jgi:CRISPR-associated protein Cas1
MINDTNNLLLMPSRRPTREPSERYFINSWRLSVGPRQSAIGNKVGSRNRRASHPINAMLNYAYAVLESQIRIQIASQGYDPTIGFMHTSNSDQAAFVLDLMEPLRPIVDRKVLEFVQAHTFHPADFIIRSDGVCRLNPEMARSVVSILTTTTQQIGRHKSLSLRGT